MSKDIRERDTNNYISAWIPDQTSTDQSCHWCT